MPQPLTKFQFLISGPSALEYRPDLAVTIAKIAKVSSQLDVALGVLLAALMRTEAEAGIAMYLALTSAPARRDALKAAAKHRLNPTDGKAFDEIMKRAGKAQARRNQVIHALWGATDDQPDALIRIDPKEHAIEMAARQKPLDPGELKAAAGRLSKRYKAGLMTWKPHDFNNVLEAVTKSERELDTFTRRVRGRYHGS